MPNVPWGEKKPLAEITLADSDRWQRFLNDGDKLAPSTVEKILKRTKTMFCHAVRDRILKESPFDDLKIECSVNRSRDAFVTPEVSARVIAACPDQDWQLIFALARFCGLRTPSEVLTLKWEKAVCESAGVTTYGTAGTISGPCRQCVAGTQQPDR